MKTAIAKGLLAVIPLMLALGCTAEVHERRVVYVEGQPPPPPVEEVVPAPPPYHQTVWVRGHWEHRRHEWVWVPGHWEAY